MIQFEIGNFIVVPRNLLVEARAQARGALLDGVRVEHVRVTAFLVETVHFQEAPEAIGRSKQELQTPGKFFEGTEVVARTVEGVVDPVVSLLVFKRDTRRERLRNGQRGRTLESDRVADPVGRADVAVDVLSGANGVYLDRAGIRVAAEQRALGAFEYFDAFDVEEGQAPQHVVFQSDFIENHRYRLVGVDVEIDVAETAKIKARLGAAVRCLDVQSRYAGGEGPDIEPAVHVLVHGITRNGVNGQWHVGEALLALLCRYGNLLEHFDLRQRG